MRGVAAVCHQRARREPDGLRAREAVIYGEHITGFERSRDSRQPFEAFETGFIPAAFLGPGPVFTKVSVQLRAHRLPGLPLKPLAAVNHALLPELAGPIH